MRPPFVEPQPALYKRKKRDSYDSGPKRKRRRQQAPEPVETFDDKLVQQAKVAWSWCQTHSREATAIAAGAALVAAAVVWYFMKEAEQESQSWLQLSAVTREIDQAARMKQGDASNNKKDAAEAARKFKRIMRDYGDTSATPFVELALGNTL